MNEQVVSSPISYDDLRAAVSRLAEVPESRVTEDADLLRLGLDSIRLMRLAGWLRRQGVPARFADLSGRETVGEWWELVRAMQSGHDGTGVGENGARGDATGGIEVPGRGESHAGGSVLEPVDESAPFDLAVMQHAFWIGRREGQQLGGVAAHFYTEFDREPNRPGSEFDRESNGGGAGLDPARLEAAVRDLVARHGMLRVRVGDDGRQRIADEPAWTGLRIHDLRGLRAAEVQRRLEEVRDRLSHRVLDIASGDVFDVQLSLLDDGASRMHVNLDMVAADAMSLRTLLADLAALYHGREAELAPLRYSYPRYLAEREPVRRAARDRAAAWWRERLPDLPGAPALPVTADDAGGGPTVTRRHHWLAPDRKQRLAERAHERGLTAASVLATAFAEVVGRWSSSDRFLLNLPVFDREPLHDDVDAIVGDFSSSVLLDVDVSETAAFADRTARIQKDLREAMGHAEYTGVEVLRDLTRAAGGEPVLAPVVFTSALELGELFAPEVQSCFGRPSWIISQGPQVWLDAQATELDGGVLLNWDARDSVFCEGVLDAMFAAYVELVEELLDDGAAWDRPAPSRLPAAQRAVRDRVNDTAGTGRSGLLHERFFRLAAARRNRTALLWGTSGTATSGTMTYGELSRRARRVAALLAARGVRPGDCVGITLPKGPEQVVAVLGVLAAGAAYVPSGVDVPMSRRAQAFHAAGVGVVLTDDAHAARDDWPDGVVPAPMSAAAGHAPVTSIVGVDGEAVMYVLFTSGSTGVPKGVLVPHRAVANTVDAVNDFFGIDGSDRTIALSALDFDLSAYDLFAFLAGGGSVVMLDESQRRDAHAWAELIRNRGVTVVSCVPALLDMLLVAGTEHLPESRLRLVMLGGDWVTVDLPDRLRALVPECRFAGLGGMTEAAIHSTVFEVDRVDPAWRAVPYGVPLANMRCRVADARGRDCPDWVPGELWVSGAGVAHGYQGDPVRTAEKFVEYGGRRWYRTGDLARYWPDGTLEFLGRADHQVKIRGHRIELGEIESHLASHPGVDKAIAAVVDGAVRRLAAAVVLSAGAASPAELREWLADRVPGYMVPEQIQVLDALPITANGKIDRKAVQRVLSAAGDASAQGFEPPSGPVEETVAALWAQLLEVDRVGRRDGFFALGGDSLLATRLMNLLGEAGLGGATLTALFTTPTLADFAATLTPGEQAAQQVLRPDPDHRFEPFPLTEVQRAYWIGRDPKLPLGGVASHFYLELDGAGIDLERLEEAWNRLVRRHEMLRAVVGADGTQRVLPQVPRYRIAVTDGGRRPEDALRELRETTSHHVADTATGPLFAIRAVSYAGDDGRMRHRIGVGLDSIALDGRSVMVLFTEWDALHRDLDASLPTLEMSFRDYVVQVRPDPQRVAAAEEYWRTRLPELPPAPRLPLAVEPDQVAAPRFRRSHALVDAQRWELLAERARRHGITPTAVLLTAYAEVLAAWSGQPDLTVNLTLFDRDDVHPDVNQVIGDFSLLLLVGCRAGTGESFLGTARRVQERLWRDLDHREVSGVRVLRELARRHDATVEAMPVVFTSVLGVGDDASLELSEAFPAPVYGVTQTPQVWLDLKVSQTRAGLAIDWDSVDELFPPGMADAMFAAYVELVEWLTGTEWDSPAPAVLPAGQSAVRDRVNATAGPAPESAPGGGLLHGGFFVRAGQAPDRPALVWDGGELSYRELAAWALRVATWLVDRGVRPGDAVAVSLPKGPGQVAGLLGVLAAGGMYVPVGVDLPPLRRERLVQSSGAVLVLDDLTAAADAAPLAEPVPVDPAQLAYTIFTSGSTGEPKGVQIAHRAAVNTIDDVNTRFGIGPDDRVLAVSAADFDLSVYDMFGLLAAGGAVVLIGEDERRDAQRWVELAHRYRVTVWNTVPALLDMLVTVAETDTGLPESLRLAMVSGDWVGLDLPGRVRTLAPGCRFVALGGATEASIWSNAFEVERVDPAWSSVPYGYPLRNQCFRVVDGRGRDCPDWVPGELWIGGTGVAEGYRGDPERTAEKFVEHDGQRWYRTGDLGRYWPDGTLEFLGRADTQVKVRGHRIELGEVEAALASHPAVAQAVVVAPGERDRKRLAAFVQADEGVAEVLPGFLAQRLPAHAVPGRIVAVDAFPLTANGKVDRAELTRRAGRTGAAGGGRDGTGVGDRDGETNAAGARFEPPSGPLEEALAGLWAELLGVDRVGRTDGFFALGGDSLLATQLVSRLPAAGIAGAELANLFLSPTLAGFAATLAPGQVKNAPAIRPDPEHRHEPFPLTDVQQAYWIGRDPALRLGGVAAQFYVEYEHTDLDVGRLEEAWNRLVARHEMLRAVVDADGTQRILRAVPPFRIRVVDLDPGLPGDVTEAELAAVREQMSRATLDASAWPLFDIRVVRYGDGRARLCTVLDNLIVDGLSILTLFGEWDRLYADLDADLPPIGLSFRDYLLQARPAPAAVERALDYWRDRMADLPPAPRLPLRTDPGGLDAPHFRRRDARLDRSTWQRITEQARRHGLTPSVVVLACYADLIGRWSEQPELTVNLTLFDRQQIHPDIDRVVGDFTSLLLAAYRPEPGESWLARGRRLQEQMWRDLDHRDVSGIHVLRELARRHDATVEAMPVVFTSMLGVDDTLAESIRWPDHTRTRTPQVWLDHQVIERSGELLLSWDSVDELFPAGLIDNMFAEYQAALRGLAEADWETAVVPAVVGGQPGPTQTTRRVNDAGNAGHDGDLQAGEDPRAGEEPPSFESPVGAAEIAVAKLWMELLDVDRVGREDGFFALGGDSLLAARLVSRLRAAGLTGARLANLFASPTLAGFAATLTPGRAETAPEIRADPEHRHEPFPLTDVQQAYWIGRRDDFVLGGIAALFATEREYTDLDVGRLEEAWNRLLARHEMLRAVVAADGTQYVQRDVPRYRIPVVELGPDLDDDQVEAELTGIREEMSRATHDASAWPLFDIRVVRYGDGRARVAVVFDTMIVDGLSMLTLFAEWDRLYADPDAELPPIGLSFRDYVLQSRPDPERLAAAEEYWRTRVPELPPGPRLPVRVRPEQITAPRFRRRQRHIDAASWRILVGQARRHDLTPSAVLLACYAEVLAAWSGQRELTVNLTLFDRRPVHPDIDKVLGDFTSLLLVGHRLDEDDSWLARARRLQQQVWRDLDHRELSGVRILRDLARRDVRLAEAVPVVFTSMLGVDDGLARAVRWPDHASSQTPQVWLDHQAVELADGVLLSWDSVDELFPDGMVDEMFAAYDATLRRLIDTDWALLAAGLPPGVAAAVPDDALSDEGTDAASRGGSARGEPPPAEHASTVPHSSEPPATALERELADLWRDVLGQAPAGRLDNFFALGGDSLAGTRMVSSAVKRYGVDVSLRAFFAAPTVADLARSIDDQLKAAESTEDGII
ncbi:non-ribosomal peptide synthetase [Phytoactinopolyspora halotolerans]|uniref:Phenyloxazoline synthase MbtB n=1 Tax=Phytoactinopolyspora halotolerans TaxID=1981512 RepID=A0A6L9SCA8_9ACTN|nr:non-ribosomal peptide synthetase [Phytoactinopolyspora halotolerans]NEE02717.1 amino acid adenylation domain-containing protein [Phytoactinopolyspora halotolerans]